MKVKAKVAPHGRGRKIVEIPVAVRDNFEYREEVVIEKQGGKDNGKTKGSKEQGTTQ